MHVFNGTLSSHTRTHNSRRIRARKNRQVRKQTQPVPSDVLEQITKLNETETPLSLYSAADEPSTNSLYASRDGTSELEEFSPTLKGKKNWSFWNNPHEKAATVAGDSLETTTKDGGGGRSDTVKTSVRPSSHDKSTTESMQNKHSTDISPSAVASNSEGLFSTPSVSVSTSDKIMDAVEAKEIQDLRTASTTEVKSEGIAHLLLFICSFSFPPPPPSLSLF